MRPRKLKKKSSIVFIYINIELVILKKNILNNVLPIHVRPRIRETKEGGMVKKSMRLKEKTHSLDQFQMDHHLCQYSIKVNKN